MQIAISAGHGKYIRGAAGSPRPPMLEEVDEARRVCTKVAEVMKDAGVTVRGPFFDDTSTSQDQNLNAIVNWHNGQSRDLDVSVHFNAYSSTSKPMGTETLYVTQQTLATTVSKKIAQAGAFINRGAKYRSDLFFLNKTRMPAILIEVCFCDSSADGDLYRRNFDAICTAIVEGMTGIIIGEPPPVEPPEPVEPPPDQVTARVEMTIKATGNVIVSINGQDFMVNAPGPETPSTPVFPPNQTNIVCTVFGGSADPNDSAYPPYDSITDKEISCALPWRFEGERPLVRVRNTANSAETVCQIRDIGPWFIDDDYWAKGTRPAAEPDGSTIAYGKHQGKTSNGAGIDLTPNAAKAIGLSGKGTVDWCFIEAEVPVA